MRRKHSLITRCPAHTPPVAEIPIGDGGGAMRRRSWSPPPLRRGGVDALSRRASETRACEAIRSNAKRRFTETTSQMPTRRPEHDWNRRHARRFAPMKRGVTRINHHRSHDGIESGARRSRPSSRGACLWSRYFPSSGVHKRRLRFGAASSNALGSDQVRYSDTARERQSPLEDKP